MSKQIRNLGAFLAICYVALFVQVNRWTVFDARELKENPNNTRQAERDFSAPRGDVVSADGVILAESVPSGDQYERQRRYPTGDLFAQVTGYFSPLWVGTAGVEKTYNAVLNGDDLPVNLDTLDDLFVEKDQVGDLHLTVRNDVQTIARDQLAGRRGSVVALDPRTGGIIAMYSNPSYDPNALSVHDDELATQVSEQLTADQTNPRLARTYQDRYPPGSTFKVVTAAGGLESGRVTANNPDYPVTNDYTAPGVSGNPVSNHSGPCGGTLFTILAESCNPAFAQMGVEQVQPQGMVTIAEAFGFNQEVPIDLPRPAESVFPTEVNADQILAQLSIGQNNVSATPLEMAMVAAAVASGGEIRAPHVLDEVRDSDGNRIREHDDEVWTRAMSEQSAAVLYEAMQGVVSDGTAGSLDDALPDGACVGGKTGTAQTGRGGAHAWIIGYAGPDCGNPQVVVAVLVESVPGVNDDQSGGQVAGPIASQVLAAALQPIPQPEDQSTDTTDTTQQQGG